MNSEIDDDKIIYMTLCVMQELEINFDTYVNVSILMQILEGKCTDNLDVWNKLTCYGCLSNYDFIDFDKIVIKLFDNNYSTMFLKGESLDDIMYKCTKKGIEFSSKYEYDNFLTDSDSNCDETDRCSCNNKNLFHCNDKNSELCDLAKEQLINWFIDEDENNEQINYKCLTLCETLNGNIGYDVMNFSFKKEKIFKDYPIVECEKYNSVQNIWSGKYKKNESTRDNDGLCSPSPTIEWCIKNGLDPKYWFDVAMSQNGKLVGGIIILDKHKLGCHIVSLIHNTIMNNNPNDDIFVIIMSANWILKQQSKPEKFMVYSFFYCHGKIYKNPKLFVLHEPFKNTQAIKKMIADLNGETNDLKVKEQNNVNDITCDHVNVIRKPKSQKNKKKTIPKPLKKLV